MKSSNFEIKLKVSQHSTKRKLFAHHIINRIFQFFIILFFFLKIFFPPFRSFIFCVSFFGFYLAALLYKMRQCRLNGTTCWWKYTEGDRMNETLLLMYTVILFFSCFSTFYDFATDMDAEWNVNVFMPWHAMIYEYFVVRII